MPEFACEIASPRYRYLESYFTSRPVLFMAETLGLAPEGERKIDQALAQLEAGIQNILESDNYQQYLRTLGKFHNYSLGNLILIWIQKQDATRVAGFNTWKDLGRFVKGGEKGIMILAPCFPPKGKPAPKPQPEEEEEEEKPEIIQTPVYFKVVHVFDIGQTEGKELPEVEVPVVQGEDSRPLFDLGLQYAEKNGIKILDKPKIPVSPETMGYFAPKDREIWVRANVPQNQQTKSLFHEIAHSRAADKFGPGAEVLAESVAYAVCNHFGFDTGVRSFPYVAIWAQDVKVLKQKLDQVRAVTKDIIEEVAVLVTLRNSGLLGDFGPSVITGLGLGIGFKTVDYLARKVKSIRDSSSKDASLSEWHTEGLACKICGRPVPPKAIPEVWAGHHIKYEHRDYVKTLAKDRLPWVAGLTVVGEDYPLRKQALQKLKPFIILEVHDDGDLTVRSRGKEWIVSTEGKAYVNYKLGDPATLEKMMLLTQEIRKRLPPIRSQEFVEDPIVQVKFFTPWTYWTWYATEFDGKDEFYGLVRGHEIELGYFSLKELESVRGPFGLTIERDRHFEPTPLSKVRAQLLEGKMADIATAEDRDEKLRMIQGIIQEEVYIHRTSIDEDSIKARARELAKMTLADLDQHRRTIFDPRYRLQKRIEKATYQGLGRKAPAWLKSTQTDIEDLADDRVLPVMKEYSGDKLSLAEIGKLVRKENPEDIITDGALISALDYLESAGEILSFEKTAEKPRRWTALEMEDSGILTEKEVPKLIAVYKTTIVKHYRAKAAFHKGSFRVLKPGKSTLIYLGCLKTDDWKGKTCSENQTLHKTIVNKTDRGMREVKKLEGEGIQVKYFAEEGIQPRAEDDIMAEIAEALKKTQVI